MCLIEWNLGGGRLGGRGEEGEREKREREGGKREGGKREGGSVAVFSGHRIGKYWYKVKRNNKEPLAPRSLC